MENEAETIDYHNKLKILPLILHQLLTNLEKLKLTFLRFISET